MYVECWKSMVVSLWFTKNFWLFQINQWLFRQYPSRVHQSNETIEQSYRRKLHKDHHLSLER